MFIDVTVKKNFKLGMYVEIRLSDESNQFGYIKEINSKSDNKKGIIVTLRNNYKGRVIDIPSYNDIKKKNFKFYNLFFYEKELYSVYDKKAKKYLTIGITNKENHQVEDTVLIFTKDNATSKTIDLLELDSKRYIMNKIKTNGSLLKSFKSLSFTIIRININRKLSKKLFIEYENKFNSF